MGGVSDDSSPALSRPSRVLPLVCALAGGALYTAAFHPFDIAECGYVWALPWLAWVSTRPSRKSLWWTGFLTFWVVWLALIPWLRHVHWTAWVLLAGWSALFPALWLLAARELLPETWELRPLRRVGSMLAMASAWVVLEWVRAELFTGWDWLPLAASQWQRPAMLQILPWTGQWGLSFVLMVVNTGLFLHGRGLMRKMRHQFGAKRLTAEFYTAIAAMLGCFWLFLESGVLEPKREPMLTAAVVQPAIQADLKWEEGSRESINRLLTGLTEAAAALPAKPDVVIWPEAGTPDAFRYNGQNLPWVEALSARLGVPLLAGAITWDEPQGGPRVLQSGISLVSPTRGIAPEFAAKRHLVPFGEYVPLGPLLGWLKQVVPIGSFTPGDKTVLLPLEIGPKDGKTVLRTGALVCYEDVFAKPACENSLAGADFHLVVTNNAWYAEEWGAKQHAVHSALRAAETRRPVLRCGNAGWSGWFDEFGALRHEMTRPGKREYFQGVETMTLDRDPNWIGRTTFYTRHGDWLVGVCAAMAGFGLWRRRSRRIAEEETAAQS